MALVSRKRYAVLLCADDSEYVKKKYGGYFGVFVRMLGEEGEAWDRFRVAANEFPTYEEIDDYDGYVITGSCSDAYGNDLWVCRLLSLVKQLDAKKKRVLGVCFGHQILGRAIGGRVGRAQSGWDIGVRQLPPKAEIIAWSDKTGIEMFRYGDHIMGIQGHPEYNEGILRHLIDRLLQNKCITEKYATELQSEFLESHEPDKESWRKICVGFLKGRL
ncbi:Gamma-glutamyl peptidase 5-like protein [Drosera capensis]